jgi:hypothetical protein
MTPEVLEVVVLEHDSRNMGRLAETLAPLSRFFKARSPWNSSRLQDERRHC